MGFPMEIVVNIVVNRPFQRPDRKIHHRTCKEHPTFLHPLLRIADTLNHRQAFQYTLPRPQTVSKNIVHGRKALVDN